MVLEGLSDLGKAIANLFPEFSIIDNLRIYKIWRKTLPKHIRQKINFLSKVNNMITNEKSKLTKLEKKLQKLTDDTNADTKNMDTDKAKTLNKENLQKTQKKLVKNLDSITRLNEKLGAISTAKTGSDAGFLDYYKDTSKRFRKIGDSEFAKDYNKLDESRRGLTKELKSFGKSVTEADVRAAYKEWRSVVEAQNNIKYDTQRLELELGTLEIRHAENYSIVENYTETSGFQSNENRIDQLEMEIEENKIKQIIEDAKVKLLESPTLEGATISADMNARLSEISPVGQLQTELAELKERAAAELEDFIESRRIKESTFKQTLADVLDSDTGSKHKDAFDELKRQGTEFRELELDVHKRTIELYRAEEMVYKSLNDANMSRRQLKIDIKQIQIERKIIAAYEKFNRNSSELISDAKANMNKSRWKLNRFMGIKRTVLKGIPEGVIVSLDDFKARFQKSRIPLVFRHKVVQFKGGIKRAMIVLGAIVVPVKLGGAQARLTVRRNFQARYPVTYKVVSKNLRGARDLLRGYGKGRAGQVGDRVGMTFLYGAAASILVTTGYAGKNLDDRCKSLRSLQKSIKDVRLQIQTQVKQRIEIGQDYDEFNNLLDNSLYNLRTKLDALDESEGKNMKMTEMVMSGNIIMFIISLFVKVIESRYG
jgi:hypothetical protein